MKKGFNKDFLKKNKVMIIAAAIILIMVVALVFAFCGRGKSVVNDLKIKYSNGEEIKFKKFNKSFKETRTITIENTSDESKTYSLEWVDVSNTLKKQNKFVYEVKGEGDRAAELGKSQVPVADSVVFTQVLIKEHQTQTYTVTFTYSGNEDADFAGKLVIKSKKVDKEKQKKEDEARNKKLEDQMKKEVEEKKKANN